MKQKLFFLTLCAQVCFIFGVPIISNDDGDGDVIKHNKQRDQHQLEFLAKERSEAERVEVDIIIVPQKPFSDNKQHRHKRATLVDERYLWPNNTVSYVFDTVHPVNDELRNLTMDAMIHIETYSCIRFKELTDEGYYVNITNSGPGCYSYLGFINYGPAEYGQTLNLADDCNGMEVTIHEFLHALGYYHEHSRPDRSDHITLNMSNILPGMETQFTKINLTHGDEAGPVSLQNISYDIQSIMHYGQYSFTKHQQLTYGRRDQMTMYSNEDYMAKLGGDSLSEKDIIRLNTKYKCNVNITELIMKKKTEDDSLNTDESGNGGNTEATTMSPQTEPVSTTSRNVDIQTTNPTDNNTSTENNNSNSTDNSGDSGNTVNSTTDPSQETSSTPSTTAPEGTEDTPTTTTTTTTAPTTRTTIPTTTTLNLTKLLSNVTLLSNSSAEDFFGTNVSNWGNNDANHQQSSMFNTLCLAMFIATCTFAFL